MAGKGGNDGLVGVYTVGKVPNSQLVGGGGWWRRQWWWWQRRGRDEGGGLAGGVFGRRARVRSGEDDDGILLRAVKRLRSHHLVFRAHQIG